MPFLTTPGGDSILVPTSRGEWYEYSGADLESVRGWEEFAALMHQHLLDVWGQKLSDVLVGREQWVMIGKSMPMDMYGLADKPPTIMGVPIVKVGQPDCLIFRHRAALAVPPAHGTGPTTTWKVL